MPYEEEDKEGDDEIMAIRLPIDSSDQLTKQTQAGQEEEVESVTHSSLLLVGARWRHQQLCALHEYWRFLRRQYERRRRRD